MITKYSLAIISIFISFLISAAPTTWTNASGDGLWNTPANWSTGLVPTGIDNVIFDGTSITNCTVDAPGAVFDGINVAVAYTGTIDLNGQPFTGAGTAACTFAGGTINDTPGTSSVAITTTGLTTFSGTTFGAICNFSVGRMLLNGSTFNAAFTADQTGAVGGVGTGNNTFVGPAVINNSGSAELRLGNTNPDIFQSTLNTVNSGTGYIRLAYNSAGNQFNGNVTLNSTSGLGVRIGEGASSSSTLAAGVTISEGTAFSAGTATLRNITQVGATAQNITFTGTAYLQIYDCSFDGDVTFVSPQFYTRGTTYNGTSSIEKNGAGNNSSAGGNTFVGNSTIECSGAGYLLLGNGSPDDFQANLDMINSGTYNMYLGYNSAGNTIGGNLTITQNGTGADQRFYASNVGGSSVDVAGDVTLLNSSSATVSYLYFAYAGANTVGGDLTATLTSTGATYGQIVLCAAAASSLDVTGDITASNTSTSATSNIYLGSVGDLNCGGNLTVTNNGTGTASSQIFVANSADADADITGNVTLLNTGSTTTTARIYLGNLGTINVDGALNITNSSGSTNSQVYLNHSNTGTYGENIVMEVTNANCDGIYFGNNAAASGTLAAGKTITVGAGGYIAGLAHFRNFTQTGATAQSLILTGTAYFQNYDSDWGGNVVFTAPDLYTRGTTYQGTAVLTKNGTLNNVSNGGNTFMQNTSLFSSGTGYLLFGNTTGDTFAGDLDIVNDGSSNFYLANNSPGTTVAGDLTLTHSGAAVTSYLANGVPSTLDVVGDVTILNSSSAANNSTYAGNAGVVTIGGNLSLTNNSTGASSNQYIASTGVSSTTIGGDVLLINAGTGITTQRIFLGNAGDITVGGDLTIENSSSATNSHVHCNYSGTGVYGGDMVFTSETAGCDGVWFGNNNGNATLNATKTVTVGAGGFVSGYAYFRNFTQVGATPQSITGTGDAFVYNYDSDWGGNISFIAPRMYTRGTLYQGTALLEKTGASADYSPGGNTFMENTIITNSGSVQMGMGNGSSDDWQKDLTLTNSGTGHLYIGYNSAGNHIGGNLLATNSGTTTNYIVVSNSATTDIVIDGDVTFNNIGTGANANMYLGNSGDVDIAGTVSLTNAGSGTNSHMYVASAASSSVEIDGPTTVINSATCVTTGRTYLGNAGDVTFNGQVNITNSSVATNSQIYCNYTGSGLYNENIVVENTNIASDGVLFGPSATGNGTLAATKTITIGAGGFMDGDLYFRNWTQVGPTAHTLTTTNDNVFTNYDSNWGGDVTFTGPRMYTRGSLYNGTSYFEKTGTGSDNSVGGNTFVGDMEMVHSGGTGYILFSNGNPDSCNANLTMTNNGSGTMYYAYNAAGCTVDGNLVIDNSNMAVTAQASVAAASTLDVGGDVTTTNTSGGVTTSVAVGSGGSVNINGDVNMSNAATGATSNIYLGNAATSTIVVDGTTDLVNSGTGATTSRFWIGANGNITMHGALTAQNNAGANNSQMYFTYGPAAVGIYKENIVLECTNATSDGMLWGANGGTSTLEATKTVTIGALDFVAGDLFFRNFTQVGPTPQTLVPTSAGTARIYNYDSDWGGNVIFNAPRHLTRGTMYNGTAYLEKNGAGNDQSVGGNTVVGDCDLICSGPGYFMMGNGNPDIFQGDLDMVNSGAYNLYVAHNSAGNTIAGDLTIDHSGSAITTYLSVAAASTLTVGGNTTVTSGSAGINNYVYLGDQGDIDFTGFVDITLNGNAASTNSEIRIGNNTNSSVTIGGNVTGLNQSSSTSSRIYLGNVGDIDIAGDLTLTNTSSGTNSYNYVASNAASAVVVGGNTDVTNSGAGNLRQTFLGNAGDVTFNGTLDILNTSTANNSHVYLNYGATSINAYNENITVQSTTAGCDGVYFGNANGVGTLAANKTITIGAGGFVDGFLTFRNFTQLSTTAQNLTITGTSIFNNYDSEWNGNVDFRGPRHLTRGTVYNGTAHLEKTATVNDASTGGNTFNDTTIIENSGTGYFMPANGVGNDYNDDVSFVQTSTGFIYPCYNSTSTFAGDVNIDYGNNGQLFFGAAGAGRALFDGAAAQSINDLGTSNLPRVRDFQVNKAGGELTLNMPVNVVTELDLDQGVVNTTATNLMTMNDNSIVSSVSDASHIDGPIEKIGNDAFVFPTGDLDVYQPIAMSAPASGSARFRGEYFNFDSSPTYDDTQLDPTIHHVSDCEYWTLDRISSANNVSVTLGFKPHTGACSGVTDPTTLVVARWDGTMWKDHGNGATTGTPTSGTISTSAAVTSFSPFTLASTVDFPVNPLPVELLTWEAVKNGTGVDLLWSTASEINNDFFTIERSTDGINFEELVVVNGAGNSTSLINYTSYDPNPSEGWNYYRLLQTDFDGTTTDQGTIKVFFESSSDASIVMYPNPTTDILTLVSNNDSGNIEVFDASGKLVLTQMVNSKTSILDLNGLSAGYYTVVVRSGDSIARETLAIK